MDNFEDFLDLNNTNFNPILETNFNFSEVEEVKTYVHNLISNPDSKDPFWDQMAENLLLSIMFLVLATSPEEKQNLYTCVEILNTSINSEMDECYLTRLIELLPADHIAVMYYKSISILPSKTFYSVFEHLKNIILEKLNQNNESEAK